MDKKKWKKPLNAFLAATLATSGVAVVTMPYEAKAATDVVYVSATGDNSNNGETATTAFATLEAAYNALPATGGTIIITSDLEMTKEKALIVNDPNKTILVKGDGVPKTLTRANGYLKVFFAAQQGKLTLNLISLEFLKIMGHFLLWSVFFIFKWVD
ncbi:hypothetical protein C3943_07665 [Lysinibacillus sp. B2A1]|nr:hypothetical protein C3943_07665 [Lysinibacillus sp. B2A1]